MCAGASRSDRQIFETVLDLNIGNTHAAGMHREAHAQIQVKTSCFSFKNSLLIIKFNLYVLNGRDDLLNLFPD